MLGALLLQDRIVITRDDTAPGDRTIPQRGVVWLEGDVERVEVGGVALIRRQVGARGPGRVEELDPARDHFGDAALVLPSLSVKLRLSSRRST